MSNETLWEIARRIRVLNIIMVLSRSVGGILFVVAILRQDLRLMSLAYFSLIISWWALRGILKESVGLLEGAIELES